MGIGVLVGLGAYQIRWIPELAFALVSLHQLPDLALEILKHLELRIQFPRGFGSDAHGYLRLETNTCGIRPACKDSVAGPTHATQVGGRLSPFGTGAQGLLHQRPGTPADVPLANKDAAPAQGG